MVVLVIPIVLALWVLVVGMRVMLVVVVLAACLVLLFTAISRFVIGAVVRVAWARVVVRLIVVRQPRVDACRCGLAVHVWEVPTHTATSIKGTSREPNKPGVRCCSMLGDSRPDGSAELRRRMRGRWREIACNKNLHT